MMTGKAVFIVCLLFALAQRAGSECLLLADVETCQDLPASTCLSMDGGSGQNYLPASKWLPVDDDSSKMLPAEALNLEVSPTNIFLGQTEVLTVNCSLSLSDVSNMSGITSLILSKSVGKENHLEKFLDLVSVNIFTPNQIKTQPQFDGSAIGRIDNDGVSFIAIELSIPTDDHAGLFRCEVHGMDNLGYSTQMFQTKLVTSQQPNVEWLTEKVSQLQIQIESQNNLTNNQQVKISKLSALAQNQSNEINALSIMSKNQSEEIKSLSGLSKNQSDEIKSLSSLSKNQSDEINTLSSLSQNQSNEINKLLSFTKIQSQTISDQQSHLDKQSQTISDLQSQLDKQSVINAIMALKLSINITDFPFHNMSSSYNGHYYLISKQVWKDSTVSAQTCKDYGGYLAQINNDKENRFVKDFLNQHTGFDVVLISGTKSQLEGRWTYTDTDTDLVFYDWQPGQPYGRWSQNCIYMLRFRQWQWEDFPCKHSYTTRKFLCELETV